jgi:hypothetical protein
MLGILCGVNVGDAGGIGTHSQIVRLNFVCVRNVEVCIGLFAIELRVFVF